jgi:hypothetical protein
MPVPEAVETGMVVWVAMVPVIPAVAAVVDRITIEIILGGTGDLALS